MFLFKGFVIAFFVIQISFIAYAAEILFVKSRHSIFEINSFAALDIPFHSVLGKVNFACLILVTKFSVFIPWNGGYPHNSMYIITPADQISHFSLYPLFHTSGAI